MVSHQAVYQFVYFLSHVLMRKPLSWLRLLFVVQCYLQVNPIYAYKSIFYFIPFFSSIKFELIRIISLLFFYIKNNLHNLSPYYSGFSLSYFLINPDRKKCTNSVTIESLAQIFCKIFTTSFQGYNEGQRNYFFSLYFYKLICSLKLKILLMVVKI